MSKEDIKLFEQWLENYFKPGKVELIYRDKKRMKYGHEREL